jgi:hypothetical protein
LQAEIEGLRDLVDYGGTRFYVSWYPVCRLASTSALHPPDSWPQALDAERSRTVLTDALRGLSGIVPGVAALGCERARIRMRSNVIFAWGETDVDDPGSDLHTRDRIGISSHGRYHSIDTGKYGMAPWFAEQLADRVCPAIGRPTVSR